LQKIELKNLKWKSILFGASSKLKYKIFSIYIVNLLVLGYALTTLSISTNEANYYFFSSGYINNMLHLSTSIFNQNDFALRFPFLLFHFANLTLLLIISKDIVKKDDDLFYVALIYILLK